MSQIPTTWTSEISHISKPLIPFLSFPFFLPGYRVQATYVFTARQSRSHLDGLLRPKYTASIYNRDYYLALATLFCGICYL